MYTERYAKSDTRAISEAWIALCASILRFQAMQDTSQTIPLLSFTLSLSLHYYSIFFYSLSHGLFKTHDHGEMINFVFL